MKRGCFNKKGQELSIGTLVLIILGVIVLVLLVLGFSIGWENLFSKIGIVQGSDLSAMVSSCKVAVASQSQGSYCEFKKVKLSDGTKEINCEYSEVQNELGEQKLTACNVKYCTKGADIKKGLKSPCPEEYAVPTPAPVPK